MTQQKRKDSPWYIATVIFGRLEDQATVTGILMCENCRKQCANAGALSSHHKWKHQVSAPKIICESMLRENDLELENSSLNERWDSDAENEDFNTNGPATMSWAHKMNRECMDETFEKENGT